MCLLRWLPFSFLGTDVHGFESQVNRGTSSSMQEEILWVEGLVPGIDFCNHGMEMVL